MELPNENYQLPKHLQIYRTRVEQKLYPTLMSKFCYEVKTLCHKLEEKLSQQEQYLEHEVIKKIQLEIKTLKEALRQAETAFNDRNLEILCHCLVSQENTIDPVSEYLVVNLKAILYRAYNGNLTIHSIGLKNHEEITQQLEQAQLALLQKSESIRLLEAQLKGRDEPWQKAFEIMQKQNDETQRSQSEIYEQSLHDITQKMQIQHDEKDALLQEMLIRLDNKDQRIYDLIELISHTINPKIMLKHQSQDDTRHSNLSSTSNSRESSPKLTKNLGRSLSNNVLRSSNSVAKDLSFAAAADLEKKELKEGTNAPAFDELTEKWNGFARKKL